MMPDIEIQTYRNKEIILIHVYHGVGPYHLKSMGIDRGTYIRFGSTSRLADAETIYNLRLLAQNTTFDALPCLQETLDSLDWPVAHKIFQDVGRPLTEQRSQLLGIVCSNGGKLYPTIGGILLFGIKRELLFPDAIVRCARFAGNERINFLDQVDIHDYLPLALDAAIDFVNKHTSVRSVIEEVRRVDIPQYPKVAIREAIANALVHSDYAMKGVTITIAMFDDRIEINNPGSLPFGITLEQVLNGSSRLRNPVIAGVFRELKLIERWGTGIRRIQDACREQGLQMPHFQELNNQFKVTLYSRRASIPVVRPWQQQLLDYLELYNQVSTKEAAQIWAINPRTAREKLRQMVDQGLIRKIGTSPKDPYAVYVLNKA